MVNLKKGFPGEKEREVRLKDVVGSKQEKEIRIADDESAQDMWFCCSKSGLQTVAGRVRLNLQQPVSTKT